MALITWSYWQRWWKWWWWPDHIDNKDGTNHLIILTTMVIMMMMMTWSYWQRWYSRCFSRAPPLLAPRYPSSQGQAEEGLFLLILINHIFYYSQTSFLWRRILATSAPRPLGKDAAHMSAVQPNMSVWFTCAEKADHYWGEDKEGGDS